MLLHVIEPINSKHSQLTLHPESEGRFHSITTKSHDTILSANVPQLSHVSPPPFHIH